MLLDIILWPFAFWFGLRCFVFFAEVVFGTIYCWIQEWLHGPEDHRGKIIDVLVY